MTEFDANAALNRILDTDRDRAIAQLKTPVALSVASVRRDIAALDLRRKELDGQKRGLAKSVAARDERATEQFSAILAELSALDIDEDALRTALESLKEDERRERLRANAAEIDEHRRRAGELASQIVEKSSNFEAALDQVFRLLFEVNEAERAMVSELRAGRISHSAIASVSAYADSRLNSRLAGSHPSWSDTTDKRAEVCVRGFRNLPSILDDLNG